MLFMTLLEIVRKYLTEIGAKIELLRRNKKERIPIEKKTSYER